MTALLPAVPRVKVAETYGATDTWIECQLGTGRSVRLVSISLCALPEASLNDWCPINLNLGV